MQIIKEVRRFVESDPSNPAAQILARLVLALESESDFAITDIYKLDFNRFQMALQILHEAVDRVARMITVDEESTPPTATLRDALANDAASHPRLLAEISKDSPREPHRQKLLVVAARLDATRRESDQSQDGRRIHQYMP